MTSDINNPLISHCFLFTMATLSDILMAIDKGDLAMLIMLDLSAAFDSVDQSILLCRLHISYGLDSAVLQWFSSYLDHRTQSINQSIKTHFYSAVCRERISLSAVPVPRQLPRLSSVEFHRGRSSDPSFSFCIQLTW